jgi:hypothetical protein
MFGRRRTTRRRTTKTTARPSTKRGSIMNYWETEMEETIQDIIIQLMNGQDPADDYQDIQ